MKPNRTVKIFAADVIFQQIQENYKKYFSNNNIYNILRYTIVLTDLLETQDQEFQINSYHTNKNNRGTDETVAHIKRQFYFPNMKSKIAQTINNCDVSHTLKF